jgi:RNA polymerase sigma-70 factor (ECF subfamily)
MPPSRESAHTDDELMARMASGDITALGELVRRHQTRSWSVALRFLGDRSAAEDLVQETFLTLYEKAPGYRPRGQFVAYLFRVLTHKAISLKRRASPGEFLDGDHAAPTAEAWQALDTAQQKARVQRALNRLPERQRIAVILRFYEDLSYEEIANALGTSARSVEGLLARSRDTLARWLDSQSSF